jgi:hypothetical protein
MPEIKRPNYFNSQFLQEKDFQEEQAYHIKMRRLLNQRLYNWGIAYGLEVQRVSNSEIAIAPGMAIDRDGREIFLANDPPPTNYNLSSFTGNSVVYLTITYDEVFDNSDRNPTGATDKFVRTTERPKREAKTDVPPIDGSVIVLAKVTLSGGSVTDAGIDRTARSRVLTPAIAANTITLNQLDPSIRPISVDGVSNPGGNIDLVQTNAITLVPDNATKRITIGESHSALTTNPHNTTAVQIGALPIAGGTLTGDLKVNARQWLAQDVTVGTFQLPQITGRITVSGPGGEIGFVRRSLTAWPATPVAGDRYLWYCDDNGTAHLWTEQTGNLLSVTKDGNLSFRGRDASFPQESWKDAPLANGWVHFGFPYNIPAYFKDSMGIVHLRGLVKGGAMQAAIFTLPPEYTPESRTLFIVASESATGPSGFGRVDITRDGQVLAWDGTNKWLSLDGITFRADPPFRFPIPIVVRPGPTIPAPIPGPTIPAPIPSPIPIPRPNQ